MKNLIPSEQQSKTVSNIIVAAATVGMVAVLYYIEPIWAAISKIAGTTAPFFVGFALAFLQLPLVKHVDRFLSRFIARPKLTRALAVVSSLLAVLAIIAAFCVIMLPQLIDSVKQLVSNITSFIYSNKDAVNKLLVQWNFLSIEGDELVVGWENILSQASNYISVVIDNLMAIGSTIYSTIFQLFVGLITAVYLLLDKERFSAQAKKICYSVMQKDTCETLIFWTRHANRIFAGFINGKIIDSAIMGALCYVGMLVFRMEYALLISVIVGVTNIIPFFGPFIGAIPSILILVLQQLDGNVIGPLILGDYVGISPLWIMVSIVIGGGLFGFVGMLLSVPVFALCYAIVRACIENRLKARGLPVHSSNYIDAPEKIGNHAEK